MSLVTNIHLSFPMITMSSTHMMRTRAQLIPLSTYTTSFWSPKIKCKVDRVIPSIMVPVLSN